MTLLNLTENPFSNHANDESIPIDGDDPQHINWIFEKAQERANNVSFFDRELRRAVLEISFFSACDIHNLHHFALCHFLSCHFKSYHFMSYHFAMRHLVLC